MNLKSGFPLSLIKNGLPVDYPKLSKDIVTDVVVIGGGISGALAAYYLTRSGIPCIVVDGRTIGLGSTCASTSLLQYEIDKPLFELIALRGKKAATRSYKLCERSIKELERISKIVAYPDFSQKDSLYFAAKPNHSKRLKLEFQARKLAGFPVEWLSPIELEYAFGITNVPGILSHSGAILDAYMLTHYILQYCIKKNVEVYDRTHVDKISYRKRDNLLTTSEGLSIKSKYIINATGYEVSNFIKKKIVTLKSTYAICSESYPEKQLFGKQNVILWNTNDPYLYARTSSDNRIIIGGRDDNFYSPKRRDEAIHRKSTLLLRDFSNLFPDRPFRTEFSWAGTFGTTKDGLPFIGPCPGIKNTYFALGFGGNGITFSQVAGKIIADLIGGRTNKDAELFNFNR